MLNEPAAIISCYVEALFVSRKMDQHSNNKVSILSAGSLSSFFCNPVIHFVF
jgi:hypothetical protein